LPGPLPTAAPAERMNENSPGKAADSETMNNDI
jgi:hypothetical protein